MNKISLQLNRTHFRGGDTVEGSVHLELDEAVYTRGVRAVIKGFEKSSWSEGSGKHRRTYSEKRDLIDEEATLFGKPKLDLGQLLSDSWSALFSKDRYELMAPGSYHYSFAFTLPPALPADYVSLGDSRIQYEVRAYVDLPLKFDLECIQPLSICEPFPSVTAQPVTAHATKSFLMDCADSLRLTATLDRNVFAVGDQIPVHVEVDNRSNKTVEAIEIRLEQVETLHADDEKTTEEYEVSSEKFGEAKVLPGQSLTRILNFAVDPDYYATIRSARLIRVEYRLTVGLEVSWAKDWEVQLPLILIENPHLAADQSTLEESAPPEAEPEEEPPIVNPPG